MTSAARGEARSKLDRSQVVDAALAVADKEGLEAVTIRRVAQDLSVTPMALYWHFKDKDTLLGALAARIWDDTWAGYSAGESDVGTGTWDQLEFLIRTLVSSLREHPAVAGLAPLQVMTCDSGLALSDRALGLLRELGMDAASAAHTAVYLLCTAISLVASEPGADVAASEEKAEAMRQKHLWLLALPPGKYPNVTESAAFLTDCEHPDDHFRIGLDLLLGGIRQRAGLPPR